MQAEVDLFTAIFTIIGAGFTAYAGVRVAIAEVKKDVKYNKESLTEHKILSEKKFEEHNERLTYVERKSVGKQHGL
jgi:hypothetical protein